MSKQLQHFAFFIGLLVFYSCGQDVPLSPSACVKYKEDGLWGLKDTNDNIITSPLFSYLDEFHNTLAVASRDGQFGCVDVQGNYVVPCEFDYIQPFDSNVTYAVKQGQLVLISDLGKVIDQLDFESPEAKCQRLEEVFLRSANSINLENAHKTKALHGIVFDSSSVVGKESQQLTWESLPDQNSLILRNNQHHTASFETYNDNLYVLLQAKDRNGAWLDIEYLPATHKRIKYKVIHVAPGQGLQFDVPQQETGIHSTEGRFKLLQGGYTNAGKLNWQTFIPSNLGATKHLVSPSFPLRINPSQFWLKKAD